MQRKERDVANERSLQHIEEREPVFIMDKRWITDLPKILEKVFELVRECPGEALFVICRRIKNIGIGRVHRHIDDTDVPVADDGAQDLFPGFSPVSSQV